MWCHRQYMCRHHSSYPIPWIVLTNQMWHYLRYNRLQSGERGYGKKSDDNWDGRRQKTSEWHDLSRDTTNKCRGGKVRKVTNNILHSWNTYYFDCMSCFDAKFLNASKQLCFPFYSRCQVTRITPGLQLRCVAASIWTSLGVVPV